MVVLTSGSDSRAASPSVAEETQTGTASPVVTVATTGTTPAGGPTSTLGPRGYGALRLGQSYAEALATDALQGSPRAGWAVKGHPRAEVCLSRSGGLMAIFGDPTMATPEGIALGSTLAEIRAAYPSLKRGVDYYYVPLSRTTAYEFLVDRQSRRLREWNLTSTTETCFN